MQLDSSLLAVRLNEWSVSSKNSLVDTVVMCFGGLLLFRLLPARQLGLRLLLPLQRWPLVRWLKRSVVKAQASAPDAPIAFLSVKDPLPVSFRIRLTLDSGKIWQGIVFCAGTCTQMEITATGTLKVFDWFWRGWLFDCVHRSSHLVTRYVARIWLWSSVAVIFQFPLKCPVSLSCLRRLQNGEEINFHLQQVRSVCVCVRRRRRPFISRLINADSCCRRTQQLIESAFHPAPHSPDNHW